MRLRERGGGSGRKNLDVGVRLSCLLRKIVYGGVCCQTVRGVLMQGLFVVCCYCEV